MKNQPRTADLHPGPGFRVRRDFPRLDPALMERFQEYDVADISDVLNRLYALDPEIKCLSSPCHRVCGPACTVNVFPGDNLMIHKALDVARPNDIIVVNGHGVHAANAVAGDIIATKAKHRGIAGFVIDGLVRDMPNILPLDFPVFARGTTSIGPLHRGPGEINCPIACGGVVINPGDLVVGDASGIVVVPRECACEIIGRLDADRGRQETYLAAVKRGEFSNAWVDEILECHGCPTEQWAEASESPGWVEAAENYG